MSVASMTGFSRVEGASGDWSWTVETRSVNGRNLDLRFRGPPGFDGLERQARDGAQSRFQRGQINVAVQAKRTTESRRSRVNLEALERYLALGESLALKARVAPPSLDGVLSLPGVIELSDQEEDAADHATLEAAVATSIGLALDDLKLSRQAEGLAITELLLAFLARIEALTRDAEALAAEQPPIIKARFERRLAELLGDAVNPERVVQEAAAMALKADVREELDRLVGHIAAARTLIYDNGASGRRLDFLTQEFMREANTLCSKSALQALTTAGLDLKATIDQFREQVQNVE